MANLYKNYLNLLKQWPQDPNKLGRYNNNRNECTPRARSFDRLFPSYRDLGQHIRKEVAAAFTTGDSYRGDVTECLRKYESLKRLADNYYGNKYRRSINKSASGLSLNHCTVVLANESLQIINKQDVGFVQATVARVKKSVFGAPVQQQQSPAASPTRTVGRNN